MKADVILWDYDGTLVNSAPKNIDITRQILSEIIPGLSGEDLPACLKTERDYHIVNHKSKNWQDLYTNYFGLTMEETMRAGSLWTEYQLQNQTPVELFPGIKQTINRLNIPQGICSQNSGVNIKQLLKRNELLEKFQAIIGYDDIPAVIQKPSAFSGIKCLDRIFNNTMNKTIVYVGDHEGDVEFSKKLERELNTTNKIILIIVTYSGANTESWAYQPDFEISSPVELLNIVTGL